MRRSQNRAPAFSIERRLGQAHFVAGNAVNRGFREGHPPSTADEQTSPVKSASATHQWIWGVSPILAEKPFFFPVPGESGSAARFGRVSQRVSFDPLAEPAPIAGLTCVICQVQNGRHERSEE